MWKVLLALGKKHIPSLWLPKFKMYVDETLTIDDDEVCCMVCLEEVDREVVLVKTKCGHVMCKTCSDKWGGRECPYCKEDDFRILQ